MQETRSPAVSLVPCELHSTRTGLVSTLKLYPFAIRRPWKHLVTTSLVQATFSATWIAYLSREEVRRTNALPCHDGNVRSRMTSLLKDELLLCALTLARCSLLRTHHLRRSEEH